MFCRNDPCGVVCIALTYAMLLHCLYVIIYILVLPLFNESFYGTIHALIMCTLVSLATISHGRAAYFDPGFVLFPKKSIDFSDMQTTDSSNRLLKQNSDGWTVCNRCDTYRPPRAHHCRVCKRCVRKLDHHCPWINNCVGEFNQKYFILFLFYIGLTSLYAISFVIWSLIVFPTKTESQIVHSIVICIESCLFGIFVVTVFIDQVQSIVNDRSLIDELKLKSNPRVNEPILPSKRILFRQVFGPGPLVCWFFPCDMQKRDRFLEPTGELYNV